MADNDRELLATAARAAGIDAEWFDGCDPDGLYLKGERTPDNDRFWNPLRKDGDSLRLAVKLGLNMRPTDDGVTVWAPKGSRSFHCYASEHGDDFMAATRRAIVRAAAATEVAKSPVQPQQENG